MVHIPFFPQEDLMAQKNRASAGLFRGRASRLEQVHGLSVSFQGRGRKVIHQVLHLKDGMAVKGFSVARDKRNPLCVEDLTEPVRVKASKKVRVILEQIVVVPMFHGRGIGPNVS
jgi:hypothetical protein